MTCIVRFFLLLMCLTLAHAASASAARGMGCHDSASRPQTPMAQPLATRSHDARAAHTPAHAQQQISVNHAHADCDCSQKCGCAQHCASSSVLAQSSWEALAPSLSAFVAAATAIDLPSTHISSLFRPPIATLA